jgi:hypothetical protein
LNGCCCFSNIAVVAATLSQQGNLTSCPSPIVLAMALEKQYFLHFAFQLVPKWDTGHGATGTHLHGRRPADTEISHSPIANIENVDEVKENFSHNLKCYVKFLCSTRLLVHQRMNANGFLLPYDLFS